jgi:PhnB protein
LQASFLLQTLEKEKIDGDRGGKLRDPFGHIWWIASHVEDVPLEEIRKRAAALFGQAQ